MIHAIFFDLDDTLLDRTATIDLFLQAQQHRYGVTHVPYAVYRQRFHILDQNGYAERHQVFTALQSEFAIPATVHELVADFQERAWQHCQLFADVHTVLTALRSRNYQLGIITNGSVESQRAKLDATGLTACIDVALISAHEGVKKPDTAIFMRAATRIGLRPTDCLFVGDNPRTDIDGAARAGLATVWVKRALPWPSDLPITVTYMINELSELLILKL